MKKMKSWTRFMVVCLGLIVLLSGCGLKPKDDGTYYKKEDFQSITVGESTLQDVYEIAPKEVMQVTSYGGVCEYPMEDGGYIRIKFYGKELIVGEIEEVFQ